MHAQVFYLARQQELCDEISALLRKHVHDIMRIDYLTVSDPEAGGSSEEYSTAGRAYMDALRASMVRPGDFRITVECTSGGSWYLGTGKQDLKLNSDLMDALFPAAAVMGRMVIMPEGVQEVVRNSLEVSSLLKPLDMQGVQLIDFHDRRSVEKGVRRVSAQLTAEVVKLCRRYMQMKSIREPDFDDLARVLSVNKRFLADLRNEILAPWARLTPKITSGPAPARRQSRVTLEVRSESNDPLGVVRVKVTGPARTLVKPVVEYMDFSAGKEPVQTIHFTATPATPPYCPFWVEFEPDETAQPYTPVLNAVMLEVAPR